MRIWLMKGTVLGVAAGPPFTEKVRVSGTTNQASTPAMPQAIA